LIEGDNGVGKTTLLKAIQVACQAGGISADVITLGEDKAEIAIEIDNRISIQRNVTAGGDSRKITVDGEPISTPVAFLKTLFGECSLDPTEFFMAKPRERRQMLLSAIEFNISQDELVEALGDMVSPISLDGFDYATHGLLLLEQVKSRVYDLRTEQNREIITLAKAIEQDKKEIPPTFDVEKFADFDFKDKTNKLLEAQQTIAKHEADKTELYNLRDKSDRTIEQIAMKEDQREKLKTEIENLERLREGIKEAGEAAKAEIVSFEIPDIESLKADINEFNESQKLILKLEQILEREKTLAVGNQYHEQLDDFYKYLAKDVQISLMSKIELPIDGLAITGEKITVNGVSLDNLSTSEQLRFGIDFARAKAKNLKAIIVDRWESMSPKNQLEFEKLTDGDGFQYCMTVVTDGDLSVNSHGEVEPMPEKKSTPKKKTTPKKKSTKETEPNGSDF